MTILCLQLKHTDPYFNLAAEEYLLKNFSDDIFLTWRSTDAIIVGKHQNALAEINHLYARDHHITVARRLSGGGTVFHDPGNLNFTFIKNADRTDQVRFGDFTDQIMGILKRLGLEVSTDPHHAIFLDGKKISGCAGHVHKHRVLHHGTLLFNSHLDRLRSALNADLSRFEGKAVQSNRREVTNIVNYLPGMSMNEFERFIFDETVRLYPDSQQTGLDPGQIQAIEQLKNGKYTQWDWIYGYSPRYCFHNELTLPDTRLSFRLMVEKGKITGSEWRGCSLTLSQQLYRATEQQKHEYDTLDSVLSGIDALLQQESIPRALLLEKML